MSPRDRVFAALNFRPPDVVPVEYHASPAGFFEHGPKLQALRRDIPDDFGPPDRFELCRAAPGTIKADGSYDEVKTDEWGIVRRHLVFGAAGIPIHQPLADWSNLDNFRVPDIPPSKGPAFELDRRRSSEHRTHYFLKSGWISLFEQMHALRPFEDVLADIGSDSPEIHRLADLLTDYQARMIDYLLARGVDAIQFGDDFGTQERLLLSPRLWRSFFQHRYHCLVQRAIKGGAKVMFHSCGAVGRLLDDIAALGVHAIWPQLNAHKLPELAAFSRANHIAVAIHPDRGDLMIRSSPDAVRANVLELAETFAVAGGGSWFYVEIDSGFPYENVVTLTETIARLRHWI